MQEGADLLGPFAWLTPSPPTICFVPLGSRNSYSKTAPEVTFMRMREDAMRNGQTKLGYNVQIIIYSPSRPPRGRKPESDEIHIIKRATHKGVARCRYCYIRDVG